MTHAHANADDDAIVTLQGEDGASYRCQVLDIFDFEEQEYAIMLRLEPEDDQGMIVMRIMERNGQSIFQTIESEDDFARIVAFLHEKAEELTAD